MNVVGSNFTSGSKVIFDGTPITATFVDAGNLTATIPGSAITVAGDIDVQVSALDPLGFYVDSLAAPFRVISPTDIFWGLSKVTNPSVPWSYGYTNTLGGSLIPFTEYRAGDVEAWLLAGLDPSVSRSTTGNDVVCCSNTLVYPADMLVLHPGPSGQQSVVRWTAPVSGVYAIAGHFKGVNTTPTTTDAHIRLNSSTSLFSETIADYYVPHPFSISQSMAAGDTIDFVVGYGTNGNHLSDSTGLAGTITLVAPGIPSLTLVNPPSGLQGATVPVTLTGANFVVGATTVTASGTGIVIR